MTFPTEFVKTQLQLEGRAANPRFHSIQSCVRWTYANYGYFGFYRGLSSLLYGSIPKAAVRFGVYEQMRSLLVDENGKLTQSRSDSQSMSDRMPTFVVEPFLRVWLRERRKRH